MKNFKKCYEVFIVLILLQLIAGCSNLTSLNDVTYPKIISIGLVHDGFDVSVLDINSGKRQYIPSSDSISPSSFSYCDKTNELVYSAYVEMGEELVIWEPNHDPRLLTRGGNYFRFPSWSPDCSLLAFNSGVEEPQIYLLDPKNGEMKLLLSNYNDPLMNLSWSPNAQFATVLIPSYDDTKKFSSYDLGIVNLSKSTLENQIPGNVDYPFSQIMWAKDGESFLFSAKRDLTFDIYNYDLKLMKENPIVKTDLDERNPVYSPDGKQFIFLQASPDNGLFSIHLFDISTQIVTNLLATPKKITALLWLNEEQVVFSEYNQFIDKTTFFSLDTQNKRSKHIAEFDGMFMYSRWFFISTNPE